MKRSIWKYLILSILLGFLVPVNEMNSFLLAFLFFVLINLILWPLQYLSAKAYAQAIDFDADVEFGENEIKINHNNQDLKEIKNWDWVKQIEIKEDRVWLTLHQKRPFGINVPKAKLNDADLELFKRKQARNG